MIRRPFAALLAIAALTLAFDQATKAVVRNVMPVNASVGVIPGTFYLTHVENVGAAFGLLPGQRVLFMLVSSIVLFVIAVWVYRQRPRSAWVVTALSLIAGGSLGNLIDRAGSGVVTDFFEFGFIEFPVFNIADTAIVVGVTILIAWLMFAPLEPPLGGRADVPDAGVEGEAEDARP